MSVIAGRWATQFSAVLPGRFGWRPVNPSFSISIPEAKRDLARISSDPKPLDRPLLVIGGFIDPFVAAVSIRFRFRSLTRDRRIIAVAVGDCLSFEQCRRRVVRAVDRCVASNDSEQTEEIDVIGYSMGGVVARYAAMIGERRLRIARLFTISSPLIGAARANRLPLLHPLQKHLRSDSPMLTAINSAVSSYPIFSYVRLGDEPVGIENAAAPGSVPWWLATPAFGSPHDGAYSDPRIVADIARRLRREPPLASSPAADLPDPD